MHYYQHNIGDYRRDTAHLSLLEHGIYRQLLDWYYLDEQPIPRKTEVVMRRLCAVTDLEKKAVLSVLDDFFFESENGFSHKRCDEEIENYRKKADKARENGKSGGRPKGTTKKPRKTKVVIFENPDQTQTKANHKPITNNQEVNTLSGKPDYTAQAMEVIDYLNEKADRGYEYADANIRLIVSRIKESGMERVKAVIDHKCRDWLDDEKMKSYLRPATLFNATKFASYAGEVKDSGREWY